MENNKPKLIFERDHNGNIWSREFGSTERKLTFKNPLERVAEDNKLWYEIRKEAKSNETLRAELERVKMLYYLIKGQD